MSVIVRHYTNEYVSALTHLTGWGLSVAGLTLLVYRAAVAGGVWHMVSFSVFGASLILAYSVSFLYHVFSFEHPKKNLLRRFDHALIYVLIAGTYTPVTLVPLRGGWGWSIFGAVWGAALLGIIWKLAGFNMSKWLSSVAYLLMGWLVVIAIVPLLHAISLPAFWWLLGGGACYSAGVIFFGLETVVRPRRWFGMHEIFHLLVMAGSLCHWLTMYHYVAFY